MLTSSATITSRFLGCSWLKLCIRVLAWTICLPLGTWTVWMSPCAPSILVHVCAAVQHARSLSPPTAMLASSAAIVCPLHLHHTVFLGPAQVQFYKGAKACILMNIDQPHWCLLNTLLASHIRSHSSEIAVPIMDECDNRSSEDGKLYPRKCLDGSEHYNMNSHHNKSPPKDIFSIRYSL